jgi:hypothetical protein
MLEQSRFALKFVTPTAGSRRIPDNYDVRVDVGRDHGASTDQRSRSNVDSREQGGVGADAGAVADRRTTNAVEVARARRMRIIGEHNAWADEHVSTDRRRRHETARMHPRTRSDAVARFELYA